MKLPERWRLIPCPHCGELNGAHLGTCVLSFARSGDFWITIAVPLTPEEANA